MPAPVHELLRLRNDRSVRLALDVAVAVLFELLVLSQGFGLALDAIGTLVAPALIVWRRRPVLALALSALACAALPIAAHVWNDSVYGIGPLLAVALPVLGGSLDDRSRVRGFAIVVAALLPLCVALWGVQTGVFFSSQSGIIASTVVVAAIPVVLGNACRRPDVRAAMVGVIREHAPAFDRDSTRFRTAIAVAVGLYLFAAVVGLVERDLRVLVTGLPLAASVIWFRSRVDVSIALAALGLLVTAVVAPFDSRFGAGLSIAALYAVVPVFGAATSGSRPLRAAGAVLVVLSALVGSALTAALPFGVLVLVIGGVPFLLDLVLQQTTTSRRLKSRLRESEQRSDVAERDVRIEQERNRIAREVHDVVAHSLAVVIAQADGARFAAEASPESVGPALEAISDTARSALGDVRTMLHDLKQDGGSAGAPGSADLPALLDGVRALDVVVDEASFGVPGPLADEADLAIFRIVQEALTNALRHGSREAGIRVETDWGAHSVVVAVTNALDPAAVPATERRGHGIPGMRERAELAGGECTAGVGTDGSFRVRVTLPVQEVEVAVDEERADDRQAVAGGGLAALFGLDERGLHA